MRRILIHIFLGSFVIVGGGVHAAVAEDARSPHVGGDERTQRSSANVEQMEAYVAGLPPGFEVVNITDDPETDRWPTLNDCGQIAYIKGYGETSELQRYDNGKTERLTNDEIADRNPDMNNNGWIVWRRAIGPEDVHGWPTEEIFLWNGEEYLRITDDDAWDTGPAINNLGHIIWSKGWTARTELMYYDLESIQPITNNEQNNQAGGINDLGEIAWMRMELGRGRTGIRNVMLHRDGVTIALTANGDGSGPWITNTSHAAWSVHGKGFDIWDGRKTRRFTTWGGGPKLNNRGDIVFHRWHEDLETYHAWYYSDGTFYKLTSETPYNSPSDINEDGEVVWKSLDHVNNDIYYLRRIRNGDADFDGSVDADDFSVLFDCMTGPGRSDRLCECRFPDIDHDGDVDVADYALFQVQFTGPGEP